MTKYLFIESRDPFESRDTRFVEETATALKQRGHEVTVFLVQNGVLAARKNGRENYLNRLANAGIVLMADEFSLCERCIHTAEVSSGIQQLNIDALVDALIQVNTKAAPRIFSRWPRSRPTRWLFQRSNVSDKLQFVVLVISLPRWGRAAVGACARYSLSPGLSPRWKRGNC